MSFNFSINYAASIQKPIYVSVATLMGVPLSAILSHFILSEDLGWMELVGGIITILGVSGLVYFMNEKDGEGDGDDDEHLISINVPIEEGAMTSDHDDG